ncbi:MAG: EthD domain-containing protein [Dehalococcoidia bacterium]
MSASRPMLVVRARIHPSRLAEFQEWYRRVHLPHALAIPGIVGYRGLEPPPGAARGMPNVLSLFLFADDSDIQKALQSREAQLARRDWEVWSHAVRDLSIQVYTGLDARVTLRHLN